MKQKALIYLAIFLLAGALIGGAYIISSKFLKDRAALSGFQNPALRAGADRRLPTTTRETRTYTAKELEEARKKGQLPPGVNQPRVPSAPNANPADSAAQRSLKAIEEINRINELNQRLLDQQRRMQNQK